MPQMSPMYWMMLMLIFLMSLILINILLYFMELKKFNMMMLKNMKIFKKSW